MEKKNFQNLEYKYKYEYKDECSESESDEYYEYEPHDDNEHYLSCRNLDPYLAKLTGIVVEEQKTDWKPPSKSGLDNSEKIMSNFRNSNSCIPATIDYFSEIKNIIVDGKTLTNLQLDYIKTLDDEEKFELIRIYNQVLAIYNQIISDDTV
jgi:hypothetical protein